MTSSESWKVEWLVATLAPWTISPHPNFQVDEVSGAAALALVTEAREQTRGSQAHSGVNSKSHWKDLLVANARASLVVDSQEPSAHELMRLSNERPVPPGARAAAALFGSVALCELEQHETAVKGLDQLLDQLTAFDSNPSSYNASQRLIIAAVCMQLSTRLAECCEYEEAGARVEQTLKWLPPLSASGFQAFAVSNGISWGAATVQRDVVRSIGTHALSLKSQIEPFGGHTWMRVVQGRTSWVDMRMYLRSADRDEIVLRDTYERRIDANSNTRHFGRITAQGAGYRSLILAELSAHLTYIRAEREKLGKVIILGHSDDPERIREALRLLRQGRATKALQTAVAWIRAQGPSISLVEDALTICRRATRANWCTEQDLLVLEGASDFLSPAQKDEAISAAFVFADTPQMHGRMSWSSWERLWKTIAKLVPASSRHNEVASKAYSHVAGQPGLIQPMANTLARLIRALDWDAVSAKSVADWSGWAESADRDLDTSALVDAIDLSVRGSNRSAPNDVGIDLAVYLVNSGGSADNDPKAPPEVASHLGDLLRREASEAAKGIISIGGYQVADVAAAFALRFPNINLWNELLAHLLDPRVDIDLKDRAVARLAENAGELPTPVAAKLREGIDLLVSSERRDAMFLQSGSSVFGEAIQLSAALGAAPKAVLIQTVLNLASSVVKDRIQAAETIPFSIANTEADATWGHALLLQLSYDSDPSVRAAAGHALVRSLATSSQVIEVVYARIIEMLGSDGIKVPLSILYGVQRSAHSLSDELRPLVAEIEALSVSKGNYITQQAAKSCLRLLSPSS